MASILSGLPAAACPLDALANLASEPRRDLRQEEVPVPHRQSTEGGIWHVYRRADGTGHSIVRTDYSETGRLEQSASFLTRENFTVIERYFEYRQPLWHDATGEVSRVSSIQYFFCGGVPYLPLSMSVEPLGTEAQAEADELRSVFLDADELTPYLADVPVE